MSTKLPEWPPLPYPLTPTLESECEYRELLADAALARMEALVEYAEHTYECLDNVPADCTCGLSELLASCARKEAGR